MMAESDPFRRAYELASWSALFSRVSVSNDPLHVIVGRTIRMPIGWSQDPVLPPSKSVVGAVKWGTLEIIQVITSSKERFGLVVDWCYAHELAHVQLGHFKHGEFLYGPPTAAHEKEADAFALAYLCLIYDGKDDELWQIIEQYRGGGEKTFGWTRESFGEVLVEIRNIYKDLVDKNM